MAVPEYKVYPVPSDMPFTRAVLAEPIGIGLESAKTAQLFEGDTVAVLGAGPIGLACLMAAKAGGHKTLVTDISDACIERARVLGADRVVNIKNEDMVEAIMDFTNGEGANVIMECAAAAGNFHPMIEAASTCGRMVLVGLIFDEVTYAPYIQVRKHLHLLGTRNSNLIPQAIELLKENGEAIEQVTVTHQLPFEEAVEGFELAQSKTDETCKIVLTF